MKGPFSKIFGIVVGSSLVFGVIIVLIGAWGGFFRSFGTPQPQLNYGSYGFMFGGYPAGVIIGLLLVNRLLHYQGSLLWGILSIIVGVAVVAGIVFIFWLINLIQNGLPFRFFLTNAWRIAIILFYILRPPLLGILGFNLRFDLTPKNESSCNVRLELKIKGVNHGQEGIQTGANHQQAA